jgi:hypothetical protein
MEKEGRSAGRPGCVKLPNSVEYGIQATDFNKQRVDSQSVKFINIHYHNIHIHLNGFLPYMTYLEDK